MSEHTTTIPLSYTDTMIDMTAEGVSDLWSMETTNTTILFYSASVLVPGEFDEKGYVDDLDFNSNREVYYESLVKETFNTTTGELVWSNTTESFSFDALYVPDGGVGILAEYGGDSTDTTASGIEHAHEYNLSDYTMSLVFVESSTDDIETLLETRQDTFGGSVATADLASNYLIPTLESGEVDGMRAAFGFDVGTTISSSMNNQIDLLAEDIYNTIPVSKYVFEKTTPIDLEKENFQPITAGELSGIGLSSAITHTTGSTTTGY